MIVDDEMDVRLMLEKRLCSEGYEVCSASNGNESLLLIENEKPDVIILDRLLGDMLGEEVAMQLEKNESTRDIPIVFVSALFSRADEHEKNRRYGKHFMLSKPYEIDELLSTVANAIVANQGIKSCN